MLIELHDIHKTFGTVQANAGISLTVPPRRSRVSWARTAPGRAP